MSRLALGIDIGGTKVAAVLLNREGVVLGRARGPVAAQGNGAGLGSIFRVVDTVLQGHLEARRSLVGIGAGAPGSIDWRGGVLNGAANLTWQHLPLAAALSERYGVPALLDNDVNVAAWGERCFGAGTGAPAGEGPRGLPVGAPAGVPGLPEENVVFLTAGTGIGAGLIEAGRIVRGRGGAGEIGHIPLFPDGPPCRCGMIGCLEARASGPALARAGQGAAAAGETPALLALAGGAPPQVTAPLVIRPPWRGMPVPPGCSTRRGITWPWPC